MKIIIDILNYNPLYLPNMSDSKTLLGDNVTYQGRSSLKAHAQNYIKTYITEQNLQPGDPLPPEKILVEKIGVSRAIVREALQGLQALGLTKAIKGKGHFLRGFNYEALLSNLDFMMTPSLSHFKDLLGIRMFLEPEFLVRSILSFSPKDITDLKTQLYDMQLRIEAGDDEGDLITKHEHFHRALFQHCQNDLLLELISLFTKLQHKFTVIHEYRTANREEFLKSHVDIVESIETGNSEFLRMQYIAHFSEPFAWVNKKIEIGNKEQTV